jgi:hypothetical protein
MCVDRQIGVPGKFWNFNRGHTSGQRQQHSLNVQCAGFMLCTSGLEGAPSQAMELQEITLGSSVFVQTARDGCKESAASSVHHCGNFVHDILPEANDDLKLTTPRQSPRKKQKFSGGFRGVSALESEVTEPAEFPVVSDEIRRWSSLSEGECQRFVSAEDGILNEFEMMCQLRDLFPLHFVVFKQTACHLAAEANVEQVFSRTGQLSEVNLDPDSLADMVSIMVNKLAYKPTVKDIMDKYHEMFRDKNSTNKKDLFNSPTVPTHSDQDSDTDG